jgi:hypothetical protein
VQLGPIESRRYKLLFKFQGKVKFVFGGLGQGGKKIRVIKKSYKNKCTLKKGSEQPVLITT